MTAQQTLLLSAAYIAVMLVVSWLSKLKRETASDFLVMNRELGTFRGAFSIAASWIWAPAVFICAQKAYEQGLPGIFWFTLPNILCFFAFIPLALRARDLLPQGYSMPDYLYARFNSKAVHLSSLLVYFGYQLGAIVINALAGGALLNMLTGLSVPLCIGLMTGAAISYSLISGLRASVITDVVQMVLILFIAFLVVPWVLHEVGGLATLQAGLGGKTGEFGNIFDLKVAYGFGIAATISLISGPVADQMFFQRAFAAKREELPRIFALGGLAFGIVPIVLSLLGFVAAAPAMQETFNIQNTQMVGPEIVAHFLPTWALAGFVLLAFAGLSSTLDSAFAAISSLWVVDVYKRYIKPQADDQKMLQVARLAMLVFALAGTGITLLQPQLLWVFLIYGALASAMFIPACYALFSKRITATGLTVAILLSVLGSVPLSMFANTTGDVNLVVLSALVSPVIGLLVCSVSALLNKTPKEFHAIERY
ncbi:MAG: hypothetical protein GC136_02855 [Alphaproteobacteria bacterium]|nr:hypothetical protein [Alphaproteobacteria bacterium]